MLIRKATVADKESLKGLWRIVFSEEAGFLEDFFASRFHPNNIFLVETDKMVVSALHALPVRFRDGQGNEGGALYIVGAATLEAYRKRGCMEALLRHVRTEAGKPVLLYPAVRGFYEKNGFFSCSFSKTYDLSGELGRGAFQGKSHVAPTEPIPFHGDDGNASKTMTALDAGTHVVDLSRLNKAYEASLAAHGGLLRDETAWRILLDEFLPKDVVQADVPGGTAYALIRDGEAVETAAQSPQAATSLIEKLIERDITTVHAIDGSCIDILLSGKGFLSVLQPEGMACPELAGNPYIGEQY